MFKKIVAIEPVNLVPKAEEELRRYAGEVKIYEDIPGDDQEIIRRIGDADSVLVSYTSRISAHVIESCPSIRYIGMCCSLYSEESANVDIACARSRGITVLGIRDYGDRGWWNMQSASWSVSSTALTVPCSGKCPLKSRI